jgi:hypothetical protein
MKHYSAASILRLVTPCSCGSPTPSNRREGIGEADLVSDLRARLVAAEDRHALARELGVSPFKLAGILRGRWPIDDDLAARLGYRRITRFEKIS